MTAVTAMTEASSVLQNLAPTATGPEVWRLLGDQGLLAHAYLEGDPGSGVDPSGLGDLLGEIDRRFSMGTTLAACVSLATCLPLLARGSDRAKEVLTDALEGRAVVALAANDDVSGSDLASLNTTLSLDDDYVKVTGVKKWIANATQSDVFLVLARHRLGPHFTNFTWVIVPATAAGVSSEGADCDLFEGSGTGHISFDGVRLSRDHVIGGVGRGMSMFASHIAIERLASALWTISICDRVLTDTLQYLQGRPYGDGTLWDLEAVRQRYAGALLSARQHHALTHSLADKVGTGRDVAGAAMLKASAAKTLEDVTTTCSHLQGAHGFRRGGPHQLRSETSLFGIGGGTTEVVLSVMAGACTDILAGMSR